MPPKQNTRSGLAMVCRRLSSISAGSSPMMRHQLSSMPRSRSSRMAAAKWRARRLPERISSPMMMSPTLMLFTYLLGASAVIYGRLEEPSIAFEGVDEALRVRGVDVRLFGKPESFARRRMQRSRHRQTQYRARMQLEFIEVLARHGHHAGVVRPRAHLAEPHLIALHEQFDAEDAATAERRGDPLGDGARLRERRRWHVMRLPALDVIALHLHVADGLAKEGLDRAARAHRAHREQGDLVIELDHLLDDHARLGDAAGAHGVAPCRGHVLGGVHH